MAEDSSQKVFNDPIHGHIELPPLCVRIIDTPQFQRLRDIKQLGAGYFVYPGAGHARFEHSLGVCHLAGLMVRHIRNEQKGLKIEDKDELCVQVAGLCHDLGHGPFSHLFDGFFIPAVKPDSKWKHEKASVDMLEHLIKSNGIDLSEYELSDRDLAFIKEMIKGPKEGEDYKFGPEGKHFLYQIISNKDNGIDVDKWDYFARDCHHLGISNMFDHLRLLKFTRVIRDGEKWQICFRDKEVSNIYDMFHTRQALHRRAYQHKTNKAIEYMITEALQAADPHIWISNGKGKKEKMSDCIDNMEVYTHLTDSVCHQIRTCDSQEPSMIKAKDILQRITKRKLFRCVGEAKPKIDEPVKKDDIGVFEAEMLKTIAAENKPEDKPDFFLKLVTFDYGMKRKDPVSSVRFYNKKNINKAFEIPRNKVSHFLPETFQDQVIRVYSRSDKPADLDVLRTCFEEWCRSKGFVIA